MLSDNLTELGYLSLMSGELNKAAEFAEEGYRLDQSIQNAWGLSYSQGVKAFINFEWGEAEEALRLVDSSIRLSDKGGFTGGGAIGHCLKSMLHTLMGDYQSAMEFALDAIQRTDKFMLFWKAEALSGLAFAQLARGEISEAETLIQQIEESNQKPYMYFFTTHVALVECEFWLKKQNVDRLTKVTGLFFHKQELGQYSLFIPYAYYYQGHTLLQMGNLDRAGEAFDLATRLARKANQRHVLWKALAMHSRLQLQAGNLNDARNEVGEAWSVIQYIADHAGSEDLRSSFLNLPEVKSVAGLVG